MADPIDVKAPDGSIIRFPAGTTDDVINGAMAKEFGGAKAPPVAKSDGTLNTAGGAVNAFGNSLSFGLADRLKAAATALDYRLGTNLPGQTGSADYGSNLADERKRTDDFQAEHPIIANTASVLGGLALPVGVVGQVGKAATLGAKTLIGAGTGGAIGALGGAIGSKDWTDPLQIAKDAAINGGTGAVIGGVIPGAAKAVGAGYEKVANALTGGVEGMSRPAGAHLIKAVAADGPAAVQARLAELGPDAMLPDAGNALLGKAQGAALNSDEGKSILFGALKTRDRGTNARIQSNVNAALGPAEDPQTVTNAIRAHRTAVDSVNYPAALDNAPPVRIAPIMVDLVDRIHETPTGSMEHRALTNLQEMLTRQEQRPRIDPYTGRQAVNQNTGQLIFDQVPVSHDDAGILHKVKGELDNIIEYDAPGLGVPAGALSRQQGALKQMRGAINSALEDQVPGYANANRVSAALAQRGEAVNLGTQLLSAGKTAPSPARFAAEFNPLDQGTKIAFAKGSRGNIDRILGQKANDLQALRGELQGEGGWNTANLATVHGQPAADELAGTVDRNLQFRDTHQKVVEGSQTDIRNAARKDMKPDPSTDVPLLNPNSTMFGTAATVGKMAVQKIANALLKSDPTRHYGEVARALTEQGAARDARLMAVVNAIQARQGNAATAPAVGNTGAVVAALLANGAIRNGPMRKQGQP